MIRVTEWLASMEECSGWYEHLASRGAPVAIVSRSCGNGIYSVWAPPPPGVKDEPWRKTYHIEAKTNDFEEALANEGKEKVSAR